MSTLRLLISDSYDPWFNLAVEEVFFARCRLRSAFCFSGAMPTR